MTDDQTSPVELLKERDAMKKCVRILFESAAADDGAIRVSAFTKEQRAAYDELNSWSQAI